MLKIGLYHAQKVEGFNCSHCQCKLRRCHNLIVVAWSFNCHSYSSAVWPEHSLNLGFSSFDLWIKNLSSSGASLVAQWLGVCLPMQGTWVLALVWEDPACHSATRPVSHNCWACTSGACAPQRERPRWWEARVPRWRVAPTCRNWRKPSCRNEDPTQP